MKDENRALLFKKDVLVRLAKAFYNNDFEKGANRLPVEMRPKDVDTVRCCVYKERAVARDRAIAGMGLSIEESDDAIPLSEYAHEALQQEKPSDANLTVIDIACNECVPSRYIVTEVCQGCLARSCADNCPFGAIYFENGRSKIDPTKCKNCGKCAMSCPYHAITKIVVPCEDVCPVGAISKNEKGIAEIDHDLCIRCGQCMKVCPFGAITGKSQMIHALKAIAQGKKSVAMVAPSIAGQFNATLGQVATALRLLGFTKVIEVAHGADVTTLNEAEELVERMEKGEKFMTTSCCPAYYQAARRHIPDILPMVSSTGTPMHYTAEIIKKEDPQATTFFVGPCVAKRHEAMMDDLVDFVLTFEEIDALFTAKDINPSELDETDLGRDASKQGRGFPLSGGVAGAVQSIVGDKLEVKPVAINGLTAANMRILKAYAKNGAPGNLIEVMACPGGCSCGPAGCAGRVNEAVKGARKLMEESPDLNTFKDSVQK